MLDHIVIHPYLAILQTPISHYCNTLQSPILQIAIYLYCKMQVALLHHLKGVAIGRHRLPQGPTGCSNLQLQVALDPFQIDENQWKSMKIAFRCICMHASEAIYIKLGVKIQHQWVRNH